MVNNYASLNLKLVTTNLLFSKDIDCLGVGLERITSVCINVLEMFWAVNFYFTIYYILW